MDIRRYLFEKEMQLKELAELAEISPPYLSSIKRKVLVPSKKLARKLEKVTNGEVTAQELLRTNKD